LNITNVGTFTDGYAVTKYINVNADGSAAQRNDIPDIDFPMFRLTDVYLMYAEATLRGATSGNTATALGYINKIRARANAQAITTSGLTLDFILDERGRIVLGVPQKNRFDSFWKIYRRI
jgi:hypothetical protein